MSAGLGERGVAVELILLQEVANRDKAMVTAVGLGVERNLLVLRLLVWELFRTLILRFWSSALYSCSHRFSILKAEGKVQDIPKSARSATVPQ